MALFKCKMCGGELDVQVGVSVLECDFCGTKQTVPTAKDEKLYGLFNRANILRMKSEFDKAEQIYEKILQVDETQAEAYWGLILCKYGIEYVEDPKTFTRIPTCHRTSFDSIIADEDYKSALQYADNIQRGLYESEAKEIDRIQKEALELSQKEEPYDVFLCYKETDETGKRTQDSVIANDIYYQLTQEGFKVFYAAITLEGKLGSAYEPIIFAALRSAKVMLSIGTKPEFFNAVWVKNEWSRFLKMMKNDRSKILIPCYKDMDAYELPEEFAHLQAQDMSKIGFINDIVRGIKKVLVKDEKPSVPVASVPVATAPAATTTPIAPLLKRAFMFLEDGEFERADEFCEQVLNQDPENAEAYLGKLMAELQVRKQEALKDCDKPFDNKNNYQKIMRFGDEKLKETITAYIEHINIRNEKAHLQSVYDHAKATMNIATTEDEYKAAAQVFESINDYKDAAILAAGCYHHAEERRKDRVYKSACEVLNDNHTWFGKKTDIKAHEEAIDQFQSLNGWKDSEEKIAICRQRIEQIKIQQEQERLKQQRQAEIALKQAELDRIEAEKRAKRNKKIAIVTTPIVCAIIAFIIVLNTVIIPNGKYNDAIALMDAGNVVEAFEALVALDGYKDSADKANSIYDQYKVEKLKIAKAGDYVFFGTYEQDNNTSNGKEYVEWLVLEVKDGKVLVISKYALDCKQYNPSWTDVTWETCTLRKWLNNDFINAAFSGDEKAIIPTVTVSADKNPDNSTNPGNATQDQVFLLSITEANQYFSSDSARQCEATDYAVANGAREGDSGNCEWWLWSPGYYQYNAAYVNYHGGVSAIGSHVDFTNNSVRPAMWIDLSMI